MAELGHHLRNLRTDEDTTAYPSPFWGLTDFNLVKAGKKPGFAFFDDFHNAGAAESSTAFNWIGGSPAMPWEGFGTTGVTMKAKAAVAGALTGVLELDTDADDEEAYLSFKNTYTSAPAEITDTAGNERVVAVEWRVKFDDVASGAAANGKFVGLGALGTNVTGMFAANAASVVVDDVVGFRALAADGDGMDAVHIKTSGAEVVVKESGATGAPSGMTIEAGTWVKLGLLHYSEERGQALKTFWYVNGVQANPGAGVLAGATNFPDAVPLVPLIGTRQHGSGDFEMDIDWCKFYVSGDKYR